jgi:hypothetical protein
MNDFDKGWQILNQLIISGTGLTNYHMGHLKILAGFKEEFITRTLGPDRSVDQYF